jgi:DNA helicase-2/ATP-dependent DNA helicase PcrA
MEYSDIRGNGARRPTRMTRRSRLHDSVSNLLRSCTLQQAAIIGRSADGAEQAVQLDPAQQAAAEASAGIQLVLAGPGSGKTTTLTGRFIRLVRQGADRKRLLALTFTRKAADEIKERVVQALDLESAGDLSIATFHGFAFRQLRANPHAAGLAENFQLWDSPQQRRVFHTRRMWWNEETDILDIIGGAKERLLDAAGFAAQVEDDNPLLGSAVHYFQVYEEALRDAGAIDFADMVPLLVRAMGAHPAFAVTITSRYDHVLVDEYQDVNPGQILLLDHFVKAGVKLWAVGDDDQTLYAFRAADVRFILDFPKKYPRVQVHMLDRNYRAGRHLVAAAKRLIAHNRARCQKNYRAVVTEPGEIVIRGYRTAQIEARQAARAVAMLLRRGHAPRQIAVLYRTGSVGLALQPALQKLGIRYEVRGAGDLWQGAAARLVVGSLHYLRDGESVEAMSRMGSSKRAEIARSKLDQASDDIKRDFRASCRLVGRIVATAVPGRASERERAEWTNVVEAVIALALSCNSLQELETQITEQSSALRQPPEDAVVLSTIHSAKGLEWDAVLMIGLEQGVLPHASNDDVEEERRVAYVGITRARQLLGLTYADARFGQSSGDSQFLHELAGPERRHLIWTEPQAQGADDRLPLLSARERQRLSGIPLPQQEPRRSRKPHRQPAERAGDGLPPRHGTAWSADEDHRLRTLFLAGEAIAELAKAHQRKTGAISSRLIKLGLLSNDAVAPFDKP